MALPNFFKAYFYGRSGKKDFTEADLPENRFQLFRDVLSVRRGNMIGVNFLYLLFWIPAILWTFMNLVQLYLLDAPDAAAFSEMLNRIVYSWLLVLFPLTAITGPFNMGISYVMRNWARDEHSFVLSAFAAALKENWKQGLLFGLVNGAIPLLCYVCVYFYMDMAAASAVFYIPIAIVLLASAIWMLSAQLLPTMIVTYQLSFAGHVRNAVLITMGVLPKAIGVKLATLIVPIVITIILLVAPGALGWVTAAALVLYGVFMLAFNKLILASYANAMCEKYLNPKIEGARRNIGLRPKQEADE